MAREKAKRTEVDDLQERYDKLLEALYQIKWQSWEVAKTEALMAKHWDKQHSPLTETEITERAPVAYWIAEKAIAKAEGRE